MFNYGSVQEVWDDVNVIWNSEARVDVPTSAERNRFLYDPLKGPMKWHNDVVPYMKEPMECATSRRYKAVAVAAPAQSSKQLPLTTEMRTPTGWTTLGELDVGSELFDQDGNACRVTGLSPIRMPEKAYRIKFDDGTEIDACAGHRWEVLETTTTSKWVRKVVTTQDMVDKGVIYRSNRSRFTIDMQKPLEFPEAELPVDPYVLGLYLGDGHKATGWIIGAEEDVEFYGQFFGEHETSPDCGREHVRSMRSLKVGRLFTALGVRKYKHIPRIYSDASVAQRRALLQGLMDTDGSVCIKGGCVWSQVRGQLADDFEELLNSLGIKFWKREYIPICHKSDGTKVNGSPAVRFGFRQYKEEPCFRLPRKLDRLRSRAGSRTTHTSRRFIQSIEPIESVPMRCISVDSPRHLYLAGRDLVVTHNTEGLINIALHAATVQPRDMLLVEKSMEAAKDFSIRRLDRSVEYSPEWKAQKTAKRDDDNVLRKMWRNGAMLSLSWPAINELSGRPVPLVGITDYDRMPMDVGKEGSPFDLARKRTTTFGSSAMTYVESSPGFEVFDHSWTPSSPHEAPPCEGIFAIYNRGDRRIWHWGCPACDEWFSPWFSLFKWDEEEKDPLTAAEAARMHCPHCGYGVSQPERAQLNADGIWVPDNCRIEDGKIVGDPRRSDIASFWLPGPAAAFQGWTEMVMKYILAMEEFEKTQSEQALKATVNTDHCEAYVSLFNRSSRSAADLENRAVDFEKRKVPPEVRYIITSIDVQKGAFQVQATGYGEGVEKWVIDRYAIRWSPTRKDEEGNPLPLDPATFQEDWAAINQIMDTKYVLESDSTKCMPTRLTICDSGGAAAKDGTGSVTEKAYRFWREAKKRGRHNIIQFLKGQSKSQAQQTIRKTWPDKNAGTARSEAARGDVPIWLVNVDAIKDVVSNDLGRQESGPGYYNFPDWLPTSYYQELTVETRDPKKGWRNLTSRTNDSFDLCAYGHVGHVLVQGEKINWASPPGWAKPQEENTSVVSVDGQKTSTPTAPKRPRGRRVISPGQR